LPEAETEPMLITYLLLGGGLLLLLAVWTLCRLGILPCTVQAAEQRAEQLLQQHMTPQQYQQLQERGYIEIPSGLHPDQLYRIFRQRQRVQIYTRNQANSGEPRQKYGELCVVACDPVPDADLFLAHKWMIEADERVYLAIANRVTNRALRPSTDA
jgi:hypothetical protein